MFASRRAACTALVALNIAQSWTDETDLLDESFTIGMYFRELR